MILDSPNQVKGLGASVLVVDRDSVAKGEAVNVLGVAGYRANGASSLSEAHEFLPSTHPWVILVDRGLFDPVGMGEVLKLKTAASAYGAVRIAMMSEDRTLSEDFAGAFEAGASAYLIKPFGGRELLAQVKALISSLEIERTLQSKKAGFEVVFQNMPEATLLIEGEVIIDANLCALDVYGCQARADLIGSSCWDFSAKTQPDGNDSKLRGRSIFTDVQDGECDRFEWRCRRLDGSAFMADTSISTLTLSGRKVIQQVIRPIQLCEHSKQPVEDPGNFLETILEHSPVPMWVGDRNGTLIRTNKALRDKVGVGDDCLVGKYHPLEDPNLERAGLRESLQRVFEDHEEVRFSTWWRPREYFGDEWNDSREFYIDFRMYPIVRDGVMKNVIAQWVDNTEQHRLQLEMRESGQRLQAVFNSFDGVPIQGYDKELNVVFWNAASEMLYGFSSDEALGKKLYDLIVPDEARTAVIEGNRLWHEEGIPVPKGEIELLRKCGERVQVYSNHIMVPNSYGEKEMFCIDVDLTDLKRVEAELVASEEKFRKFVENANDIIYQLSPTGVFTYVSPNLEEILGYSVDQFVGQSFEVFTHPDDFASCLEFMNRVLTSGEKQSDIEYRVKHRDGSWRWHSSSGSPVLDSRGNVIAYMGIARDISPRKEASEKIEESLALINESQAIGRIGSWDYDIAQDRLSWSDEMYRIAGIEVGAPLSGWEQMQSVFREDWELSNGAFQKAVAGTPYEEDFRILWPDGTVRWARIQGSPLRDARGEVVRLVGTTQDITERKEFNVALRESQRKLELATGAAGVGIWDWDVVNDIQDWDEQILTLLGVDETCQTYRLEDWEKCLHPDDRARATEAVDAALQGEREYDFEFRVIWPDGSVRWIQGLGVVIRDEDGNAVRMLGTNYDITRLKEIEEELRLANGAKDEFLAVMSHDLRSPLNPIIGMTSLLLENAVGDEVELLNCIKVSGERMLSLVDSLLEFARLDSGFVDKSMESFNLIETCLSAFNEVSSGGNDISGVFRNGGANLLPIAEELDVVSDRSVVVRILVNLLQNAYKYTEEGGVRFTVGQTTDVSEPEFCFVVEDTGIGIDEATLPTLFEPFTQADTSFGRTKAGVGLGLAICSKLVELLEGSIEVQSELGVGSTFTLQLPLQVADSSVSRISAAPTVPKGDFCFKRPVKVLIAEDEPANILTVESIIKRFGGTTKVATNGREAVEFCQENIFDVILMDLRMPEVDGFEATELIKKSGQLNSDTPIIAATANVSADIKAECQELGMSGFLRKPIRMNELFEGLNKAVFEQTEAVR